MAPKCDIVGRAVVSRRHPNALWKLPSRLQTATMVGVWWRGTIAGTIVFRPSDYNFWQSTECIHLKLGLDEPLDQHLK